MILYKKRKRILALNHINTILSTNREKVKKGFFFWLTSEVTGEITGEPKKDILLPTVVPSSLLKTKGLQKGGQEKLVRAAVTCILQRKTTCSLRFLPPSRKLSSVSQLPFLFPAPYYDKGKDFFLNTKGVQKEGKGLLLPSYGVLPTDRKDNSKGWKGLRTGGSNPCYEFKIAFKNRLIPTEYSLETFHRSNQDTCLLHNPAVFEGDWVQSGDLLADCAASSGGELSLGKNILVAYMPWEGYNFEDAILISERLVFEDVYSSIHIERYDIEIRETKYGRETITREIPELSQKESEHLDLNGIAKLGSWIQEGDILVGRVTPINKTIQSNYKNLLYTILETKPESIRDSSLRAPRGMKGKIVNIQRFSDSDKTEEVSLLTIKELKTKRELLSNSLPVDLLALFPAYPKARRTKKKKYPLFSSPFPLLSPLPRKSKGKEKGQEGTGKKLFLRKTKGTPSPKGVQKGGIGEKEPKGTEGSSSSSALFPVLPLPFLLNIKGVQKDGTRGPGKEARAVKRDFLLNTKGIQKGSLSLREREEKRRRPLLITKEAINLVYVYLAEKRKIQVGDKMAGRHGNKGIVSQVLPRQDMPFLANGTPIDMVLNPLGVPSRMNVGQIYECLLGLAAHYLGEHYKIFPFDEKFGSEASRSFVYSKLYEARKKTGSDWLFDPNCPGKTRLFDGRTGDPFDQTVTVGYAYMLKLVHLVDDKIHMRSTGPYSLVTQQPLRGRSKQGGQRLGEMEVWALEGYGAAFTLLEMLTLKSDDMTGRMTLWSNLILNKDISIGTPESFKVLICELQALCLDIGIFRADSAGNLTEIESLKELP